MLSIADTNLYSQYAYRMFEWQLVNKLFVSLLKKYDQAT